MSNWLLNTFSIVLISRLFKSPVLSKWPHLFTQPKSGSSDWWKSSSTSKFILSFLSFILISEERGHFTLPKTSQFSGNKSDLFYHTHLPLTSSSIMGQAINYLIFDFFSSVKLMSWTTWIPIPLSLLNKVFLILCTILCLSIPQDLSFSFSLSLY